MLVLLFYGECGLKGITRFLVWWRVLCQQWCVLPRQQDEDLDHILESCRLTSFGVVALVCLVALCNRESLFDREVLEEVLINSSF